MPLANIKREMFMTCEACKKQILLCSKCGNNLKTGTKVWCLKADKNVKDSLPLHLCLACNNGHKEKEEIHNE